MIKNQLKERRDNMNKKYPKKLIIDYIYGNDIENYDIDILEEDPSFMKEVIKLSKDKNIYNLCSDNIKTNYGFIKTIIETFKKEDIKKEDIKFVEQTARYYLSKTNPNSIEYREIIILLNNITNKNNCDELFEFTLRAEALYLDDLELIMDILERDTNKKFGCGFILFKEKYQNNDTIIKHIANRLISDIFDYNENGITLEALVHIHYRDKDSLKDFGINNFIITYISALDSELADYISVNLSVITPIRKAIIRIINNWDNYMQRLNERRAGIIYEEASKFIKENEEMILVDYYGIVDKMIINLKLDKILGIKPVFDEISTPKELEEPKTLKQIEFENKIYNLIKELFKIDHIVEDYSDYELSNKNFKKYKRTIIPLNRKRKD